MTASSGFAAKGISLTWNNYPIAELTNVSGPSGSAVEIDVTNHDSEGNYKEFVMGALDGGEVTIEGNFVPGDTNGQKAMKDDYDSRTSRAARIIFPEGRATWEFSGYVQSYSVTGTVEGKATFTATVRVTGQCTVRTTAATGLSGLTVSVGTLAPAFATGTYWYHDDVVTGTTTVNVTPSVSAGTIYVNGSLTSSGSPAAITLGAAGTMTRVTIEARETSKASKVYRLTIHRAAA